MRHSSSILKTTLLSALTLTVIGCGGEAEVPELESEALEIIENLQLAGYPEQEINLQPDGTVYVGRDAEVSIEASREMAGLDPLTGEPVLEGFRQYRTTNLVSSSLQKICIDGSLYTNANGLSQALNTAIARFNALNISFTMQRTTGNSAGCNAYITAKLQAGYGGLAGFPALGKPYDQISVGTSIVSFYGTTVASHVILHELGHCVGLRHSDYYDRSITCSGPPTNEGDAGIGAHHIPGTPPTAVVNGSVMNSCYNAGSTGIFTPGDVTGLETVYPSLVCQNHCEYDLGECEEDFCYWDYNEYMCYEGCEADYLDCLTDCPG